MNPRALLLTLSVLGNAALVAAWIIAPSRRSHPDGSASPSRGTAAHAAISASAEQREAAPAPTASPAKPLPAWTTLDTPDLDELARRLKAAGFTPAEIRIILSRRIEQMIAPAGAAVKSPPYWQPRYRANTPDPERRKQIAELQRLYRKYLMNPEGLADDPDQLAGARRRWGDLPVDKLQAIATIESDFQELQMKQYAERGARDGNAAEVQRLLEQERMADIAKVLTPEEFAAYELRASATANVLRFRLETFKANEDEYKSIFAITKAYEDRWNDRQLTPDARTALNNEMTAKVKDAIGADRALDYDAAVNQNSSDQTAGLVSRLGLPARVATEVRQTQQDFTQRGKDIRANASLSPDERNAQLAALASQAKTQLTTKLGADGYEAYSDLKGEWIRALNPAPGSAGR